MTRTAEAQAQAFIKANGISPGSTVHINHDDCGDTRKRLYITVKADRTLVMWCHNCQQWGGARLHARGPRIRPGVPSTKQPLITEKDLEFQVLSGVSPYLEKYGIIRATWEHYGVQWEMKTQRYHYPIKDVLGHLIGGQLRVYETPNISVFPELKFITWRRDASVNLQQIIEAPASEKRTLVITEDYLSALKVVQTCPCDALPLLTTSIQVNTAMRVVKRNYDLVIVWLDNDSFEVSQASDKIVNLLQVLGCRCVVRTKKYQEPKKTEASVIKAFIEADRGINA